jgi:hypothetical protein
MMLAASKKPRAGKKRTRVLAQRVQQANGLNAGLA